MKIFNHIHTIFLLLGFAFIDYAAFLLSQVVGFLVSGLICLALAMMINGASKN